MVRDRSKEHTELLTKAIGGDIPSFGIIYDEYAASLLGFVLRLVKDKKEAEDLLFLIFIEAWKELQSNGKPEQPLFSWLISKARFVCSQFKTNAAAPDLQMGSVFEELYYKGTSPVDIARRSGLTTELIRQKIKEEFKSIRLYSNE
jgi:hypothetical protein